MFRSPRPRFTLLRSILLAAALIAWPVTASALGNGKLQIHHIDVGQGDGMLLVSPNGETALFDDGTYTDCSYIKTYLQGLGITSVDYHFLSHYHADHLGCIDDLAAIGITVATAGYDRGYSYSSASYDSYVATLGAKRMTVAKGQTFTFDAGSPNPVTITCVDLNGAGVYSVSGSDENSKSAVFRVSYGGFVEVIGGDLTGSVANNNDVETTVGPEVGNVDVYKVHHHGSKYSSNDNWLNAVTPEVGVIQCGDGNSYGHPTVEALTRLHNHGVKTYWIETGAGATPDPSWDKVAHGTVLVEVDLAAGSYAVSGPGFADTYPVGGGGPPPVLVDAATPSSVTFIQGNSNGGSAGSLAVDDGSYLWVKAGRASGSYRADWYGTATLAHPPTRVTVNYNGNLTATNAQTLYLYNWSTSAWDPIDQATVGPTDITRTWTTTTPGNYVSGAGEMRCRVQGGTASKSYTCKADYMAFVYEYQQGTAVTLSPPAYAARVAAAPAGVLEASPQAGVERLEAVALAEGVKLTWATAKTDHMDGFNVYREKPDGGLEHVGVEATIDVTSDDVLFGYTDAGAAPGENVYWLGARSCSGPEGMIGPLRVTRVATAAASPRVALSALPNPAATALRFGVTLGEVADLRLDVFDLSGRRVATPYAGRLEAGAHELAWNLTSGSGSRLPAGFYFARIEALGRTSVVRVSVLRP